MAQIVPVNRLDVGLIPTRGDEIFIYIYIFISLLWCRGESAALSSGTQNAMPQLAECGKRSVLTLGAVCLLCAGYSVKLKKKLKEYSKFHENRSSSF